MSKEIIKKGDTVEILDIPDTRRSGYARHIGRIGVVFLTKRDFLGTPMVDVRFPGGERTGAMFSWRVGLSFSNRTPDWEV